MNKMKLSLAAVTLMLLAGCGGGGGSQPVATPATFNLLAAFTAAPTAPSIRSFTISGTVGTLSGSGSGTVTTGMPTAGTFEGKPAQQRLTVVTGNLIINGTALPLNSTTTNWYNESNLPVGTVSDDYEVVIGTPTLPTSARVGDTGTFKTSNRYASSSKFNYLGTSTTSYVVEADTTTTVIVRMIRTYKDRNGVTTTVATDHYQVSVGNIAKQTQTTLIDTVDQRNLVLTYL